MGRLVFRFVLIALLMIGSVTVFQSLATNLFAIGVSKSLLGGAPADTNSQNVSQAMQNPGDQQARLQALLLSHLGQSSNAIQLLNELTHRYPQDRLAHGLLGNMYDQQGQLDLALEEWGKAGAFVQVFGRCQVAAQLRRWMDAELCLHTALALGPQSLTLLGMLGSNYQNQKKWGQAEGIYRQILTLSPQDSQAHLGLGMSLYYQGVDLSTVLIEINQAIQLNPKDGNGYQALGNIYYDQKSYDKALEFFSKAFDLTPDSPWPIVGRAEVLLTIGNSQSAIDELETAIPRFPKEPHLEYLLAYAYLQIGSIEDAITAAERSVALDTSLDTLYLMTLARAYEAGHLYDQAITVYQKVLSMDPTNSEASQAVARLGSK